MLLAVCCRNQRICYVRRSEVTDGCKKNRHSYFEHFRDENPPRKILDEAV
jgi:hypothetical protein